MFKVAGTTTLTLSLCLALGACHSPRGGVMPHAGGSSSYVSTEMRQVSISIVDVRSDEEIFYMDVPPGKQLSLDFVSGRGDDTVMTPDLMRWQIFDAGTSIGRLRNSLTVPNASSRRIDVHFTQDAEYAQAPPEERLRSDQQANRPSWWTAQGGEMPSHSPAEMYDQ